MFIHVNTIKYFSLFIDVCINLKYFANTLKSVLSEQKCNTFFFYFLIKIIFRNTKNK